jgi:long-chain acyl-CoA synthetase
MEREITLPQMFLRTVGQHGGEDALRFKTGGAYQAMTYSDVAARVRSLTLALADLGIRRGDRICLLSENRPEWVLTDLAALSLGAVLVPIYPTLPSAQVEYIVRDAGATLLAVSDGKQLEKALAVRERLPDLRHIVVMEPPAERPPESATLAFAELAGRGAEGAGAEDRYQALVEAVRPGDLASIVYTSGTTGEPKGAMLTHGNFTSDAAATLRRFDLHHDDVFLTYIPLSHIFSRLVTYAGIATGACTAFAQSIITVAGNIAEVRPTLLPTVPRLLESIQSRAMAAAAKGAAPGSLKEQMGGRLRAIVSGGGPLAPETAQFFSRLGLLVVQGYGLTETAGVVAVQPLDQPKIGTVGPPLEGVEVRIAEDGEILCRGPNIMQGYYNKPEETRQVLEPDGWFHTGDIGDLDENGHLRITDRKKDLIVLSNGKKVAPQAIERVLKESPYISEVALFGDNQSVVVALIIPSFDAVQAWAGGQGLTLSTPGEIAASPEVRRLLKTEIDARSGDLADFERVRRFAILDREFSMEREELTPTLKLRRRVVARNFAAELQRLYGGDRE